MNNENKPTPRQSIDFEITTLVARAQLAVRDAQHALSTYLTRLERSQQDLVNPDGCFAPPLQREALLRALERADELCGYANAVDTFRKADK